EIECELTSFGWREAVVGYAAKWWGLRYDLKNFDIRQFGRNLFSGIIQPPVAKVGDWYTYRLGGGKSSMTSYVKRRKLHEEPLPADADPWLSIQVGEHLTGGVRNLRIKGNPTVPESLDLTKPADLSAWVAYYDEPTTGDNAAWEKRGEEIFGRSSTDVPGSK